MGLLGQLSEQRRRAEDAEAKLRKIKELCNQAKRDGMVVFGGATMPRPLAVEQIEAVLRGESK